MHDREAPRGAPLVLPWLELKASSVQGADPPPTLSPPCSPGSPPAHSFSGAAAAQAGIPIRVDARGDRSFSRWWQQILGLTLTGRFQGDVGSCARPGAGAGECGQHPRVHGWSATEAGSHRKEGPYVLKTGDGYWVHICAEPQPHPRVMVLGRCGPMGGLVPPKTDPGELPAPAPRQDPVST